MRFPENSRTVTAYNTFQPVKCVVRGFPRPSVQWKHGNETELRVSDIYYVSGNRPGLGRNLTLGNVTLSDRGDYFCVASSTTGSKKYSTKKKFIVGVNSKWLLTFAVINIQYILFEQVTFSLCQLVEQQMDLWMKPWSCSVPRPAEAHINFSGKTPYHSKQRPQIARKVTSILYSTL